LGISGNFFDVLLFSLIIFSVSVNPGQRAVAVTPVPLSSIANASVNDSVNALLAA
jgi:hypothetical protein